MINTNGTGFFKRFTKIRGKYPVEGVEIKRQDPKFNYKIKSDI